ncbi:3-methyl-2-oxobutanoate hydroxymethyltransferase, partial [Streptomyces sp. SID8382]|nr:3-methyl-2-oxobutanoate hydroxymethyltransferase [Streptomyces sp. SID8382]
GRHCFRYGITTAGVVLGQGFEADDAVAALRPYARVLLLAADESDVFELLTALRV